MFTNLWFVLLYVVLIKTDGGLMGGGGQISCFGSSFGSVNDPINTDYCSFTFASSCTSFSHEINVCCMFVFVCARARLYTFIFVFFHFILHFMLNLWCVCTYLSTMSVCVFVCVFVHVHKGVCFLCLFVRLHACMFCQGVCKCLYVHVQSPLVPLDKRRYKEQVLIVKAEKGLILLSHTHTYKHTHTTCGYTHTSMPTQTIS